MFKNKHITSTNDDGKELFGLDENNGVVYRINKDVEEEHTTTTSRKKQHSDKKYLDNDNEKKIIFLEVEKDDED